MDRKLLTEWNKIARGMKIEESTIHSNGISDEEVNETARKLRQIYSEEPITEMTVEDLIEHLKTLPRGSIVESFKIRRD